MRPGFSSYHLIDFTIAGALEQHPNWSVNKDRLANLKQRCAEIDDLYTTGNYRLTSDVDEDMRLTAILTDEESGFETYCLILSGFFVAA